MKKNANAAKKLELMEGPGTLMLMDVILGLLDLPHPVDISGKGVRPVFRDIHTGIWSFFTAKLNSFDYFKYEVFDK